MDDRLNPQGIRGIKSRYDVNGALVYYDSSTGLEVFRIDASGSSGGSAPVMGNFTPTINVTSGSGSGVTYSTNEGSYVKIGGLVYIRGRITLTNNGALDGNIVVINGLPFTILKHSITNPFWFSGLSITSWVSVIGLLSATESRITLYGTKTASAQVAGFPGTDISDTTDLIFSGEYFTTD